MGWLGTNRTSDAMSGSPRTAYDESKSSEQFHGTSSTARSVSPFPWAAAPVRHPFQLTNTSNAYSTAPPSITSDTPLHPTSHLDLLPTPTAAAMPINSSQNPSNNDILPERRPPTRISYRGRPVRSWIAENRKQSLFIASPFPITLSIVYIVVGHAILRAAQSSQSQSSYELAPLSSSAKAGAVGGAILTLPIMLLLYVVQRMCMGPSNTSGPDDFFDDESDAGDQVLWRRILAYALLDITAVFVGTVAGPIGVSILKSSSSSSTLSAAQGAASATIGGMLFLPLIILLCVVL